MKKKLSAILLKAFGSSLIITLLLLTILLNLQPAASSNLHFNVTGMIYGISISILLGLTLSSTTIFFNTMKKVRDNICKSFLAFTLLPIIATIFLMIITLPVSGFSFWVSCVVTLPYLAVITYHFINFRRNFQQII